MPKVLRVIFVLVALASVAGLFVVLRPDSEQPAVSSQPPAAVQPKPKPKPKPKPEVKVYRVRVSDGKPVGGVRTLAYRKGDQAKIVFSSRSPIEVHLHGYDLEASGSSGSPAVISLKASLEGRFEIEDHDSGNQLALLEVRP